MPRNRNRWRSIFFYPFAGILLSFSAPLGWLIYRNWNHLGESGIQLFERFHSDILHHPSLYAYMLAGAMMSFTLAGLALGYAHDRLRYQYFRVLSHRRLLSIKNRQLARLSTTDRLTGLANRFRFEEVLLNEFNRAQRYGQELSLLMVDVDYFKNVNDTFGHDYGDFILHEFGQIFAGSLRDSDHVARTGGEEFCFILPQTHHDDALSFAERLRKEVENYPFEHNHRKTSLTISIGVATLFDLRSFGSELTPSALYALADRSLYEAKRKGRNCIVRASSMVESSSSKISMKKNV